MKLENLLEVILQSGANVLNKEIVGELDTDYNLNRTIHFQVGGQNYKIIWFHNMSTLYVDENTQVMFNSVVCRNTWPVEASKKSKQQLQFEQNGEKVCILITERY